MLHAHQRIAMAAQEICESVAKQHIKSHNVDRILLDRILSGDNNTNICYRLNITNKYLSIINSLQME